MNKCQLLGYLGDTPELRTTPSGLPVTTFSLAVHRRKQKDKDPVTDWFNIVAWRNRAEFAAKYLHKGQRIVVTGEIQNRDYTDKNNNKRRVTEIIAEDIYFADGKAAGSGNAAKSNADYPEPPEITGLPDEDDYPF